MQTSNAVKRIEKAFNVKFDMSERIPSVQVERAIIELYRNGEKKLAFINVRRCDDKSDMMTDYHAGSICDTIKGAIEMANFYNTGKFLNLGGRNA